MYLALLVNKHQKSDGEDMSGDAAEELPENTVDVPASLPLSPEPLSHHRQLRNRQNNRP